MLRLQDREASDQHNILLANSATTKERIWKYYRKQADVLYPPIETERFAKKISPTPPQQEKENVKYYIILSALTEFKRIDIALKNFPESEEVNLKIIGMGDREQELKDLTQGRKNIFFL